jgi:type VI protein secretion system component Hcp
MVLKGFAGGSAVPLAGLSFDFTSPGSFTPPIVVTRDVDMFSPGLVRAVEVGTLFSNVNIKLTDPTTGARRMHVVLKDAILSSLVTSAGALPQETITIIYTKFTAQGS